MVTNFLKWLRTVFTTKAPEDPPEPARPRPTIICDHDRERGMRFYSIKLEDEEAEPGAPTGLKIAPSALGERVDPHLDWGVGGDEEGDGTDRKTIKTKNS